MIGEPLWNVGACRIDADLPRTPNPRAWDTPRTPLEQQVAALVARQREQAPTTQPDTTPAEEAS